MARTMADIFRSECERLRSFNKWPLVWLDKYQLAQTGMFYTGSGDRTQCYFCGIVIAHWKYEYKPLDEHLRLSPNCSLLRRRPTNNVALCEEALNSLLTRHQNVIKIDMHAKLCCNAATVENIPKLERDWTFEEAWPNLKPKTEQPNVAELHQSSVSDDDDRLQYFNSVQQTSLYLNSNCADKLMEVVNNKDTINAKETAKQLDHFRQLAAIQSDHRTFVVAFCRTEEYTRRDQARPFIETAMHTSDERLCKICFANDYNTVFLPCGHVFACLHCASILEKCAICRQRVTDADKKRIYFA